MGTFLPLSKSATSTALHLSEALLLAFGVLLVVGLMGEIAKSPKWKPHLRKFELMVVIGVAGELIADGGIFVFSERLQTISDAEVATLGHRSETLRLQAATIERENLKMRAALGPRLITDEQQERITQKLAQFAGTAVDVFVISEQDQWSKDEAVAFGKILVSALNKARMDAMGLYGHSCKNFDGTGVYVIVPDNTVQSSRAAAEAIVSGLSNGIIKVSPIVWSARDVQWPMGCQMFSDLSAQKQRSKSAETRVIVGKKPEPILNFEQTQPVAPSAK